MVRKAYGPLISKSTGQIDEETANFLKRFAMKWKSRSIFQVLLQYRAVRYQDLVHFSQQVTSCLRTLKSFFDYNNEHFDVFFDFYKRKNIPSFGEKAVGPVTFE